MRFIKLNILKWIKNGIKFDQINVPIFENFENFCQNYIINYPELT